MTQIIKEKLVKESPTAEWVCIVVIYIYVDKKYVLLISHLFSIFQLTHGVMNKELKACKNPEDLECNENVKHKTKEYIKKYMQRFGSVYGPKEDTDVY